MTEILIKTFSVAQKESRAPALPNERRTAFSPPPAVRGDGETLRIISQAFINGFGRNLGLNWRKFIAEYDAIVDLAKNQFN